MNENNKIKSPTVPACQNCISTDIGGRKITYSIRESTRAKKVNLKITVNKGLEVVVPMNFPFSRIEPLLKNNEAWIVQKLDALSGLLKREKTESDDNARQVVYFLGNPYRLVTVLQQGAPSVELIGDKIVLILSQKDAGLRLQILEAWLRHQAKEIISKRASKIKEKLGIDYNQLFIKDQKTRWGSCSSQGNLNFNYRIVMAPLPVIDYLVAHELAHLIEMNHSKNFWALIESVCPDYKKHRQWLNDTGKDLTIKE